ncbi:hypothetical protein [uncultured Ruminococcus sp.]|nr:hypothetical protein [uncultured Ruminococcus sp.]
MGSLLDELPYDKSRSVSENYFSKMKREYRNSSETVSKGDSV